MEITTLLQENWKEDKVKLEEAISSLKKEIKEHKKARKAEWKTLKSKFKDELRKIEKSLKELKSRRKK